VPEIVVGVLLPLSSDYAAGGEESKAAIEVAAGDINDYFTSIGSDYRVRVILEDTRTDPAVALEKLEALDEQGVKIVIGFGTSTELEAARAYADEHGIILISTMSTAPLLAITDDNAYRFVPPDTYQAGAIAYYLKADGIAAVVPIWRGDIWGDELEKLAAASFARGNGTVLDGVRYEPGETDYTGMVADLDVQVGRAIAAHGKEKVGVYLISLDEAAAIMEAASKTKNLTEVRWYGCDGNVLIGTLVTGDAGRFAAQTKFTGPEFGRYEYAVANTSTVQKIRDALGRQPNGYSLVTYDALWIVAMTQIQTETTDISKLKIALEGTAKEFSGPLFGSVPLTLAGDLLTAHYLFWSVSARHETYTWTPVAQYDIWAADLPPQFERIDA